MGSSSLTLNGNGSSHSFGSQRGKRALMSSTPPTFHSVSTPMQGTAHYIEALDHLSTKLRIPASEVEPTNALQDDGLVPGICRLYLEGRCRQGTRCFQIHVPLDVVERLRKEALETPSCCHFHGAPCNYEGLPLNLRVTIGTKSVGLHSLSPTNCLWSAYSEHGDNHLVISKGRVCREHRRGLCRFGEECGFLHICREVPLDGDEYISATPLPIPRVHLEDPHNSGVSAINTTTTTTGFHNPSFTTGNRRNCEAGSAGAGEACLQYGYPSHAEEGNLGFYSPNASSFGTISFNGAHPNGLIAPQHGNGACQSTSFVGAESGFGSLNSMCRSRQSFSSSMKHAVNGEGENLPFTGRLLHPLAGAHPRGSSQRHNPYGDSPSAQ